MGSKNEGKEQRTALSRNYMGEKNPEEIADFLLNYLIQYGRFFDKFGEKVSVLKDEEEILEDIISSYAFHGRTDDRSLALARRLSEIRVEKQLGYERLAYYQNLKEAIEEIANTPEIKPHFERLIQAKLSVVEDVLSDPDTDESIKLFFQEFRGKYGRLRG